MVVVTLIAGAAVLGWVNGQAGNSEQAYGNSAANNINYLNERFAAESQVFTSLTGGNCNGPKGVGPSDGLGCGAANFYLYNDGSLAFTLYSIQIVNAPLNPNPLNIVFYSACTSSAACTNPSNSNREVVIAPAPCSVSSPCYAPFTQTSQPTPPTGFYLSSGNAVVPPLPISTLSTGSNGPYQITLPNLLATGQLYIYNNEAYTFTFTGLYGNTIPETITVTG